MLIVVDSWICRRGATESLLIFGHLWAAQPQATQSFTSSCCADICSRMCSRAFSCRGREWLKVRAVCPGVQRGPVMIWQGRVNFYVALRYRSDNSGRDPALMVAATRDGRRGAVGGGHLWPFLSTRTAHRDGFGPRGDPRVQAYAERQPAMLLAYDEKHGTDLSHDTHATCSTATSWARSSS